MAAPFDISEIRSDFPVLDQSVRGQPLVYLDNAATSQKPRQVLDAARHYYEHINSNIHRGVHHLSQLATAAHEVARETCAQHLNAPHVEEIIFTSGTTDSINLIANILADGGKIPPGSEIVLSGLEHHSNIVPWQLMAQRCQASIKVIPVLDEGTLDLSNLDELITDKTAVVAFGHVSNAFGTINDVSTIISAAKKVGAITAIDGAQSVPHMAVDLSTSGADFYSFSGHKIFAPTGIGILWGRKDLLEELPPYRGGGEMIKEVSFDGTTYNDLPFKYEAGTPNIEGAISLAAALDYANAIGMEQIAAHEHSLLEAATPQLREIDNLHIYADLHQKAAVLSFNIKGIHHFDLGSLLDQMGIAVRTGHHCCQPLMKRFGVTGTVRASFAIYNTTKEVETLVKSVKKAALMLA